MRVGTPNRPSIARLMGEEHENRAKKQEGSQHKKRNANGNNIQLFPLDAVKLVDKLNRIE